MVAPYSTRRFYIISTHCAHLQGCGGDEVKRHRSRGFSDLHLGGLKFCVGVAMTTNVEESEEIAGRSREQSHDERSDVLNQDDLRLPTQVDDPNLTAETKWFAASAHSGLKLYEIDAFNS